MAMGRRTREEQGTFWVPTGDLPQSGGHPFYEQLNKILDQERFDAFAEERCRSFYAEKMGRPSLPPAVYFRMLLIGYFEGIDSERGIAWRVADSLALRRFLCYGLTDQTADHSTLSRNRRLIDVVFGRRVRQEQREAFEHLDPVHMSPLTHGWSRKSDKRPERAAVQNRQKVVKVDNVGDFRAHQHYAAVKEKARLAYPSEFAVMADAARDEYRLCPRRAGLWTREGIPGLFCLAKPVARSRFARRDVPICTRKQFTKGLHRKKTPLPVIRKQAERSCDRFGVTGNVSRAQDWPDSASFQFE